MQLRVHNLHRPGITLLEVLTAIFIMGIGMLAILTLFPAGALSMARAIRDDRAAVIAANAVSLATAMNLRNDTNVFNALNNGTATFPNIPANKTGYQPSDTTRPGNPVLVDPHLANVGNSWCGANPQDPTKLAGPMNPSLAGFPASPGIQRVSPTFLAANVSKLTARYFVFQDEMKFDSFGGPQGSTVNRPGTYSHAYLVRYPRFGTKDLMELSVIVFSQRVTDSLSSDPTVYFSPDGETPFSTNATPGSSQIVATPAANFTADVRRNSYILDTTYDSSSNLVAGYFYKVITVTESGTNITLELDRPLRNQMTTFVHFRDIIAVVERGVSWRP